MLSGAHRNVTRLFTLFLVFNVPQTVDVKVKNSILFI